MKIDEMEAGQDLDALIAEKVLGCKVFTVRRYDGTLIRHRCDCAKGTPNAPRHSNDFIDHVIKPYSCDMGAAWEVVESMHRRYYALWFSADRAQFAPTGVQPADGRYCAATDGNAALAICRAALKVVGDK